MTYFFNILLDTCAPIFILIAFVGFLWFSLKALATFTAWADNREHNLKMRAVELEEKQVGLEKQKRDLEFVIVDGTAVPVHRGDIGGDMLPLLAQVIANQRPVQPVPHSISYAPHISYDYRNDVNATNSDASGLLPAPVAPADFWQLYSGGQLPQQGFLMGFNMLDNQPIQADWGALYSALIGGGSGTGKSTLMRSILAQSALQGGKFLVIDPHYGSGGQSTGESLLPLRRLMVADVAATPEQMLDSIRYASDIGRRRLTGKDQDRTPFIVVVDECTALFARSDIASELGRLLGEIAQETRKVNVFAMCLGQNFDGRIMDTTIRNSFVSMLSCRARRDVARVQSGNTEFGKVAETLRVGQAVWMNPNGEMTKLMIPNTTAQHLALVGQTIDGNATHVATRVETDSGFWLPTPENLASGTPTAEANGKPTGSQPAANFDSKSRRAIELFQTGHTMAEIISEVWSVSSTGGGRRYNEANHELQNILREYMYTLRGGK